MHRALDGFPNVKSFGSFVRSEETVQQPESKPKPKIDPEKYFNDMNSFDIWQSFVSSFFLVPWKILIWFLYHIQLIIYVNALGILHIVLFTHPFLIT